MYDRMIDRLFVAALALLISVGPVLPQAALLPNAKQQFFDQNGNPLSGGKVYFYVPNTTVPKTTWQNSTQTTANTNPVTLDAGGWGVIYGQGSYQQKLTKANGDLIWNAPTTAWNSADPSGATGTDTAPVGTVMQYSGFTLPTNWEWANGQAVSRTTYDDLLDVLTLSETTMSCTSGSPTLGGWSDTSQMRIGAPVEASCIPTGTVITAIPSSSNITVNNNATATATTTGRVFPWGNGDGVSTFNVPDLRGRVVAGADVMNNTAANRLQATTTITTVSGALTATVASASSLFAGMNVISTNIPVGTTISALTSTTIGLSQAATGTASGTAVVFQALTGSNAPGAGGGSQSHALVMNQLPSATLFGSSQTGTASATINVTGYSLSAGGTNIYQTGTGTALNSSIPALSVLTSLPGGSAPHPLLQPTITSNFIIKAIPNTSGAGGVVSINGMFGDIVCDATFQCTEQGSPAVGTIGLATQLTGTVLANVGASIAQATPTTWTQWMDFVCGSAQGDVAYRGVSGWGCLPPGTNGQYFKTQGAGANPTWSDLPVASALTPGIVQGDGSTLTISAGVASCTTATDSQIGCSKPDGTTIVIAGGAYTAVGAATSSVGVGVTTVASGTNGYLLYDNAGVLGATPFTGLLDPAFGSSQGSLIYRAASAWTALSPGTSGQLLQTQGAGADPRWTSAFVSSLNSLTGTLNIYGGTGLSTITASAQSLTVTADIASAANFQAGTANKLLDAANVFTAETTTTYGLTTTLDASTFINTKVTLTGNITTMVCSNFKAGQAGTVAFIQDGTGSRLASHWCSTFKFANGLTPTLSTAANTIDILAYACRTTSFCTAALSKAVN